MSRAVAAISAILLPLAGLAAATPPAGAIEPRDDDAVARAVSIRGHGYGHGHGMSQHGAQGAAIEGKSHRQILRFYYPHTRMGSANGRIRVLLTADHDNDVVIRARPGLLVRDRADGRTFRLPGWDRVDRWRIKPARGDRSVSVVQYLDGSGWHRWRVPRRGPLRGAGQFEAKGPIGLVRSNGSTARYRGVLRAAYPSAGSHHRDTVNAIRMNKYVRGVIADEMPASWRAAALRAQAVAARTYAAFIRRDNRGDYYQICDTTSCQVYGGVAAETDSTDRAVAKTGGQIRTYDGAPAFTQFSASSGGWTVDGGPPYLPAKRDPYDDWSGNTVHNWSTRLTASRIQSAYPSIGRFRAIRILDRDGNGQWGGRVLRLRIVGGAGSVRLSGDDFRWAFGLRSTWFTVR
jgi:stage II sporulation protein D